MTRKKSTTTHTFIFLPLELISSGYTFWSNITLPKIKLRRITLLIPIIIYIEFLDFWSKILFWHRQSFLGLSGFQTTYLSTYTHLIIYLVHASYSCSYYKSYIYDSLVIWNHIFQSWKISNLLIFYFSMVLQTQTCMSILNTFL